MPIVDAYPGIGGMDAAVLSVGKTVAALPFFIRYRTLGKGGYPVRCRYRLMYRLIASWYAEGTMA